MVFIGVDLRNLPPHCHLTHRHGIAPNVKHLNVRDQGLKCTSLHISKDLDEHMTLLHYL